MRAAPLSSCLPASRLEQGRQRLDAWAKQEDKKDRIEDSPPTTTHTDRHFRSQDSPFLSPWGVPARLPSWLPLLLLLLAPVVAYPRKREPAFGLRQLREFETSDNGRRMTHDFTHDDPDVPGRRIELNYDVELAPHIRPHDTDDEEHLASVVASADGKMCLIFDSAAAAAAFAGELAKGDLLHGHYQDGPGEEAAVFPYHARVLAS